VRESKGITAKHSARSESSTSAAKGFLGCLGCLSSVKKIDNVECEISRDYSSCNFELVLASGLHLRTALVVRTLESALQQDGVLHSIFRDGAWSGNKMKNTRRDGGWSHDEEALGVASSNPTTCTLRGVRLLYSRFRHRGACLMYRVLHKTRGWIPAVSCVLDLSSPKYLCTLHVSNLSQSRSTCPPTGR